MSANPWEGMRDARPSGGGNWLPAGFKGTVKIERCLLNSDGFKGDLAFIAEFTIMSSNLDDIHVGTSRSWYQGRLQDRQLRQTALGEIMSFVAAAMGYSQLTDTLKAEIQDTMPVITGEDNPLAGSTLCVETWNKPTKAGSAFTKHKFTVAV